MDQDGEDVKERVVFPASLATGAVVPQKLCSHALSRGVNGRVAALVMGRLVGSLAAIAVEDALGDLAIVAAVGVAVARGEEVRAAVVVGVLGGVVVAVGAAIGFEAGL